MSIFDKLKDLPPLNGAHIKRVRELEAKHRQMANERAALLNRLSNKQLFTKEDLLTYQQGFIDCGYDYEVNILQTIFDKEDLGFLEQAVINFRKHILESPVNTTRGDLVEDKLRMLQKKLEA